MKFEGSSKNVRNKEGTLKYSEMTTEMINDLCRYYEILAEFSELGGFTYILGTVYQPEHFPVKKSKRGKIFDELNQRREKMFSHLQEKYGLTDKTLDDAIEELKKHGEIENPEDYSGQ